MSAPTEPNAPVLLYDGVCGVCNGAVRTILRFDSRGTLRFAALDSDFARDIIVGDDGRAKIVAEQEAPSIVTLTMDWPTFLNLSCGRGDASEHRKRVTVEGDQARAGVVLDNFCVMI